MKLAPHDVVIVVGKRGQGKSSYCKRLIAQQPRAAAFDVHDEHSQLGRVSKERELGQLRQRCTVDELVASRGTLLDRRDLSLAIVPDRGTNAEVAEQFQEVAALVSASGNMTFLVDEVAVIEAYATEEINTLATQSRHYSMPVIFSAQRLVHIPKTARTQATRLTTFLQNNPEDLKALEELVGREDFAQRVARLKRWEHLDWRDQEESS